MGIIDDIATDEALTKLAGGNEGTANMLAWIVTNRIYELAYFYKAQDWKAEDEIRALVSGVVLVSDTVFESCRGFHMRDKYLIPHIVIPTFDKDQRTQVVSSVTAGPCLNRYHVKRSFEQLISPTHYSYRQNKDFLKYSDCQFRPVISR